MVKGLVCWIGRGGWGGGLRPRQPGGGLAGADARPPASRGAFGPGRTPPLPIAAKRESERGGIS